LKGGGAQLSGPIASGRGSDDACERNARDRPNRALLSGPSARIGVGAVNKAGQGRRRGWRSGHHALDHWESAVAGREMLGAAMPHPTIASPTP